MAGGGRRKEGEGVAYLCVRACVGMDVSTAHAPRGGRGAGEKEGGTRLLNFSLKSDIYIDDPCTSAATRLFEVTLQRSPRTKDNK